MTLRRHLTDVRPLRASRNFREIWAASLLTGLAAQIAAVAALAQIWDHTRSPIWTGAIGLAQGIPLLLLGAVGGSLADRYDRRTIVLISTLGQAAAAAALTLQAALGNSGPLPVLAIIAAGSAANALGSPARRTLPVRLLPRDQVAAGLALQNMAFQISMLVGPAIGGLLIAVTLPAGYAAQALMMPLALVAAFRLPSLPPDRTPGTKVERGGWGFPLRMPVLRGALLTDLATMTLSMPIAIFPMINDLRFDGDPRTLGLFLSAIGAGGIAAGLASGFVTRLPSPGLVQLVCAATWGAALVGFAFAPHAALALAALAVAGAADTVGVVTRGSLVQLVTPDAFRGRVSAVDHVIGVAGPEVGNMRGGVLAAALGAPAALAIGGASAVVATILIGVTHRDLRQYQSTDTTEPSADMQPTM
ncbi:MFS transporter [Pseudactinotalea sp.]|uniref:MFS transporter n=1 Tax=Pseudactinotalea sp. TaxID=1926260 RepID=UPI003B3B56EE